MGFPFLTLLTHTEVKKLSRDSSNSQRAPQISTERLHQHEEYPMEGTSSHVLGDKASITKLHSKAFKNIVRVEDYFLNQFLLAATSFFPLTFVSLSNATFKVYYIVEYYFFINLFVSNGVRIQCKIKHH